MREKQLEELLSNGHVFLKPADKGHLRNQLLKDQEYKCAVCEKDLKEEANTNRHIDHCHKSKVVRGVLCATCNLVLGKIERAGYSNQWLHQLSNYLMYQSVKTDDGRKIIFPEKIVGKRKTLKEAMKGLIKSKLWKPQ